MVPLRLMLRFIAVVLIAAVPRVASAAAANDAASFMNDLGTRVLSIIKDKNAPEATRKIQFKQLAEQSFDIPSIARFVLGRYWRTASPEDRQRFVTAFENYMVQVYWSRFSSYNGQQFKVLGHRDEGNGTILVTTQVLRPQSGQPPVKIDWQVVKKDNQFKIRDASLEGVSQALTYRDEFSSIMERNNGQVLNLIRQLNERAKS